MTRTIYTVRDQRGLSYRTEDTEQAERLSRAGYDVTAVIES